MQDGSLSDIPVARSQEKLDFQLLPRASFRLMGSLLTFKWLYTLEKRMVWFVSRSKANIQYRILRQHSLITNKQINQDENRDGH